MSSYNLHKIRLRGIAACVPAGIEYTKDYSQFSETEARTFEKKVGVSSKRSSKGKHTTSDLCFQAAERLIADLKWKKDDIGLLLFISQTADYALPPTSVVLQGRLGLSPGTFTLDVNLGCTGWVNGLSIAGSLMHTMNVRKALLLVGETAILSGYADKATYPLMGDAGVATALEMDDSAPVLRFNSYTDGDKYKAIIAPRSGARYIAEMNGERSGLSIQTCMDGTAIFEFSKNNVLPAITGLLHESVMELTDLDFVVFHQANKLITESMRKKLGIPEDKCPYSIGQFGNTSSASIPLTILTQIGSIKPPGKKLLFSSFGVGLSVANVLTELNDLHCSELVEL